MDGMNLGDNSFADGQKTFKLETMQSESTWAIRCWIGQTWPFVLWIGLDESSWTW